MYNELEFIVSALVGFTCVSLCSFSKHSLIRSINKLSRVLMILSYFVSSIFKPKKRCNELCNRIIQIGANLCAVLKSNGAMSCLQGRRNEYRWRCCTNSVDRYCRSQFTTSIANTLKNNPNKEIKNKFFLSMKERFLSTIMHLIMHHQ